MVVYPSLCQGNPLLGSDAGDCPCGGGGRGRSQRCMTGWLLLLSVVLVLSCGLQAWLMFTVMQTRDALASLQAARMETQDVGQTAGNTTGKASEASYQSPQRSKRDADMNMNRIQEYINRKCDYHVYSHLVPSLTYRSTVTTVQHHKLQWTDPSQSPNSPLAVNAGMFVLRQRQHELEIQRAGVYHIYFSVDYRGRTDTSTGYVHCAHKLRVSRLRDRYLRRHVQDLMFAATSPTTSDPVGQAGNTPIYEVNTVYKAGIFSLAAYDRLSLEFGQFSQSCRVAYFSENTYIGGFLIRADDQ